MSQGGSPAIRLSTLGLIIFLMIGSFWVVRDLENRELRRLTADLPIDLVSEPRAAWLAQITDINRLLQVAQRLLTVQEYQSADSVLARAESLQPELRDVQLMRAWANLQIHLGQPTAEAQAWIDTAFRLDPLDRNIQELRTYLHAQPAAS